jgi:hypothetical protein
MQTRKLPSSNQQPRGYCLVLTVLLLAIASTLLLTTSRRTIRAAMNADQGARDLQREWGVRSIARELSGHAAEVLEEVEKEKHHPIPTETIKLDLGKLSFEIRISDEDAKLHVATLLEQNTPEQAARQLRQCLSHSPLASRVALGPSQSLRPESGRQVSFGDVFVSPTLQELTDRNRQPAVSDQLTCYGSGKLNLLRASDQTLRIALNDAIGALAVSRLMVLRQQDNLLSLPQMIDSLILSEAQQHQARQLLSMNSQSYSILILADHRGKLILEGAGKCLEW